MHERARERERDCNERMHEGKVERNNGMCLEMIRGNGKGSTVRYQVRMSKEESLKMGFNARDWSMSLGKLKGTSFHQ